MKSRIAKFGAAICAAASVFTLTFAVSTAEEVTNEVTEASADPPSNRKHRCTISGARVASFACGKTVSGNGYELKIDIMDRKPGNGRSICMSVQSSRGWKRTGFRWSSATVIRAVVRDQGRYIYRVKIYECVRPGAFLTVYPR